MLNKIKHKVSQFGDRALSKKNSLNGLPAGYFGCADEITKPCVSGWVSSIDECLNPVALKITKGDEIRLILANDERYDVLNAGKAATALCGYSANFSENNFDVAKIEILSVAGEIIKPVSIYKGRKIFFIHIPKAAGSSVNECISSAVDGPYYTHIEGLRERWDEIKNAKFLSGHVRYEDYERSFSHNDYVVVAFLREPLSHIKSHINWVRRLTEPELIAKRENHTGIVQKIADELATCDFSDIDSVRNYVKNIKPIAYGLFDNCQVRYLASVAFNERVTEKHLAQAIENLNYLHFVGISEYSKESQARLISILGLKSTSREVKSNVNAYDYGLNVHDSEIAAALMPLVQFDLKLYEIAKARFLMDSKHDAR